jgi:hypothetical protein
MKTQSRIIKFATFSAVATLGVIGLCVCSQPPVVHWHWPPKPGNCKEVATLPPIQAPFHIKIGTRRHLKEDNDPGEEAFVKVLCNGNYKAEWGNRIHIEHKNANYGKHCLPQDCSDFAQASIQTDKVIASETAKRAADEELTSIGRHVTQQIACQSQEDLDAVSTLLKP